MNKFITLIKRKSNLVFLFIGVLVLIALLSYMDFSVIAESFNQLGKKIGIVFVVPIFWIVCNVLCVSTLIQHRVPFWSLMYNQITGDAYNVITPFAGLGGEPYKIKHLTNWLSLDEASELAMRDRLIHSLSGILYTGLTLWVVVLFVNLETSFFLTFSTFATVLTLAATLLGFLILSEAPNKFLGVILKKLKLLKDFRSNPLKKSIFLKALVYKLLGRALNMIEFLVILYLLGMQPTFLEIATISAMLSLSGTLLFIIPQGIGVNEAGISGAFKLIGQPIELGLGVGLIRRARVLFWALFGIALHFSFFMIQTLSLKKRTSTK